MANWAIVIGIDKYWSRDAELEGCVDDAIKVMKWLLDTSRKGGNVPPQNIYLLTRPAPPPEVPIPGAVQRYDAKYADLVTATKNLINRSGGKGDRLFFYFSGHGITNTSGVGDEGALVMADFDETFTDNAVESRSVFEYFQSKRFKEQFFIIDACRDALVTWPKFLTRRFTLWSEADPKDPAVQQFTLLAASPLNRAVVIEGSSVFTEELLNGLQGMGKAVFLDAETGEYVVDVLRLFAFVEARILARKINVSEDPDNPRYQSPRISGERGSQSPVLARLTQDEVKNAQLLVSVEPDSAWPQAELKLVNQYGEETSSIKPITTKPVAISLPPMMYTLRASAAGHTPAQPKWPVVLYEDRDLPVKLVPNPSVRGPAQPIRTKGIGPLSKSASLTVKAKDSLAVLELKDSRDNLLSTGHGEIVLSELAPGFYMARMITPEGKIAEEAVELSAGEDEKLLIDAPPSEPSPMIKELIEKSNFNVGADDSIEVSKEVGPIASAQLSTILALAGNAVNHDTGWGHRLRSMGLKSFRELAPPGATSGLHILSGVEFGTPEQFLEFVSQIRLCLWPIDKERPNVSGKPLPIQGTTGLSEFAQAAEPGHYWLMIEWPDNPPVVFSMAMLRDRLTMMVFHRNIENQLRIYQYLPSLVNDENSNPKLVRLLELAQRFCLNGRLDHAYESAKELLTVKSIEPLAACLGAYLLLKLDRGDELETAVRNLTANFGDLCDVHVLRAEFEAIRGNADRAEQSYIEALERGVPVFAEGLTRLFNAIKRFKLENHTRAGLISEVVEKRVLGLLWTAWTPSKEIHPPE